MQTYFSISPNTFLHATCIYCAHTVWQTSYYSCPQGLYRALEEYTWVKPFTLNRPLLSKKKKSRNNKCWQGCTKIRTLCTVGRNIKWYICYGKQYGGSSKNKELSYDLAIPLLDVYPKELKAGSQRSLHTYSFSSQHYSRYWRDRSSPNVHRWTNNQTTLFTMKYYSAFKKKRILLMLQHGWTFRTLCWMK